MRVAVCQMTAGRDDLDANVETAVRLLDGAAGGGADLAALPELWPFYGGAARMRELATAVPGELTEPIADGRPATRDVGAGRLGPGA